MPMATDNAINVGISALISLEFLINNANIPITTLIAIVAAIRPFWSTNDNATKAPASKPMLTASTVIVLKLSAANLVAYVNNENIAIGADIHAVPL